MNIEAVDNAPIKIVFADGASVLSLRDVVWSVQGGHTKQSDALELGDVVKYTAADGSEGESSVEDVFFNVDVSPDDLILSEITDSESVYIPLGAMVVENIADDEDMAELDAALESIIVEAPVVADEEPAAKPVVGDLFSAIGTTRPTDAEIQAVAARLPDGTGNLKDAIFVALMAEHLDAILKKVRNRDAVMNLMEHLSTATWWLTSLASRMGLEVDGYPVAPSRDFPDWQNDKLKRLLRVLAAEMDRLSATGSRSDSQLQELAEMRGKLIEANDKVGKLQETITANAVRAEASTVELRQRVLDARTELTRYRDLPEYVVSRVDPTTRACIRYVALAEDEALRMVPLWGSASKFETLGEARVIKARCIRHLRRRGKSFTEASDSFAIVRVAHHEITEDEE